MAKKGNGEGSIYPHKKNGKKVGYRGAYWVHTAEGPKRRYVSGKTREENMTSSSRPWAAVLRALSSMRGALRSGNTSHAGWRIQ